MEKLDTVVKVRKNNGELVPFDKSKLLEALRRSGASPEHIKLVDQKVAKEIYDGIPTKKIFKLAYATLRNLSDHSAGRYRLKNALMKIGPTGYPFEHFVAKLLEHEGYTTKTGQIIHGKCVKHEVDVVAHKDNKIIMAECKFHRSDGVKSDVKISLYVRSRFTDIENKLISDGEMKNMVFQPMLITNTRFTDDAIQFGKCSGLQLISWDYPQGKSLKERIDKARLFPITVLKSLKQAEIKVLLSQGIVLCRQVLKQEDKLIEMGMTNNRMNKLKKEVSALI